MGIVVKAYVLCATDNPDEAEAAVFAALNSGSFESESAILDFAIGTEQKVHDGREYSDGQFIHQVPAAALLKTVNSLLTPF